MSKIDKETIFGDSSSWHSWRTLTAPILCLPSGRPRNLAVILLLHTILYAPGFQEMVHQTLFSLNRQNRPHKVHQQGAHSLMTDRTHRVTIYKITIENWSNEFHSNKTSLIFLVFFFICFPLNYAYFDFIKHLPNFYYISMCI